MLTVAVLGPIELRRDGAHVPVRAGKTTEALIRLALDAGRAVPADRLIEDLWGEAAGVTHRNTLQTKISQLRKALGDTATVTAARAGYTLHIDPAAVDALEVLRLADTGRELLEAGDAASTVSTCTAALAMFRGEILADAGDGDWVIPHRTRLDETRLRLLEHHIAARLQLGAAGDLIGELQALVTQHPLREHLCALLITALYRDGRQADALATYRDARIRLVDELGVEPGPELRALEQQVLRHDDTLDVPTRRTNRREVTGAAPPAAASQLVGRDADIDQVGRLLTRHHLVTLTGPAGVGKTRLATEVAGQQATGRTWLVRLDDARTGATVAETVGAALHLYGATDAMLVERLSAQPGLLILDNCEHVVDTVADLAGQILADAPPLRILATSQLPLGLDSERVYQLEPLSPADSVALFARRASERRRSFALDDTTEASVVDVCRALDGLPLAIELAASRIAVLPVHEIARRLDDRFALLRDPTSRRPERRRALSAAIAWSYDLLFPDDQRGLWALAAFAGGATLDALETVLATLDVPAGAVRVT